MIIKEIILFQAGKDQVWDLLTNPAMTEQYMFGSRIICDWAIGSPILWMGKTENGNDITYVKGEILSCDKGVHVTSTMFDPNAGLEDIPANYITLTYVLTKMKEGTQLTITQGGYSTVDNGKNRYEESKQGWQMVIPLMKKVLDE